MHDMDKMTRDVHQGIIIELEDYKYLDFSSIKMIMMLILL